MSPLKSISSHPRKLGFISILSNRPLSLTYKTSPQETLSQFNGEETALNLPNQLESQRSTKIIATLSKLKD